MATTALAETAADPSGGAERWTNDASTSAQATPRDGTGLAPFETNGTSSDLQATVTGGAATALAALNQLRAQSGLAPLVDEPLLATIAQAWAAQSANTHTSAAKPGVQGEIPGNFGPGAELYSYGSSSNGPTPMIAGLAQVAPDVVYGADYTHVGVGYSTDGAGAGYLYILVIEYQFRDVGPSSSFYNEIDTLVSWGITTGYADRTFRPTGSVTREAMAAFLYRYWYAVTDLPACDPNVQRAFSDVTTGNQFCGAIEWLATTGITTGYPDGTYRPKGQVTREAMAAFIYRFWNMWNDVVAPIPPCDPGVARMFTDVTAANQFCGAIEWMATTGITTGWPDGTFRPKNNIARQAMAAFLVRLDPIL